jgi:hypothetical protein
MKHKLLTVTFIFLGLFFVDAQTDSTKTTVAEINKQKQNPVSGLKSIYFEDEILPIGEGNANSFSIQPVYPFKISEKIRLVTYTIIPFEWIPPLYPGGSSEVGLGNILFNGYFSPQEKKGNLTYGLGPALQIPTRTNPALGSNRLSVGPSALIYYGKKDFSLGAVIQNFWSLGGTGINEVNMFNLQYIAFYNLKKAWYIQSNAIIEANWLADQDNTWLVPIGGGLGKTFQIGKNSKLFYSGGAQVFYNVVKPDIVGDWQAILALQIIFP